MKRESIKDIEKLAVKSIAVLCKEDKEQLDRIEKRLTKLEEYFKSKASPVHNEFPDIFNVNGYCRKCGKPPFFRESCELCMSYKDKAMKILNKFLGIER